MSLEPSVKMVVELATASDVQAADMTPVDNAALVPHRATAWVGVQPL